MYSRYYHCGCIDKIFQFDTFVTRRVKTYNVKTYNVKTYNRSQPIYCISFLSATSLSAALTAANDALDKARCDVKESVDKYS
jgi:hypothetical protein